MYALIGLSFLLGTLLIDTLIWKTWVIRERSFWIVLLIMIGFTLVFDQFLTGLPIIEYDQALTSGLRIGHVPVEDLFYTVVATIGIGALLKYETKR